MRRSIVPALAMFVLLVAGACGGSSSSSAPPASQPAASQPAASVGTIACKQPGTDPVTTPVAVSISNRTYDPDPVQAKVGEAIEWHNEDGVPHTAALDDLDCSTDQLIRGQTGTLVFAEAGTYAYHCNIHSTMHGTITIAP
jgi:plastocyanin